MRSVPEEVKSRIKESVDVESLLSYLGFKVTKTSGSEVRAPCVLHGGDNPTGFSMRLESRKWRCFTGKCEIMPDGRAENDLIALVMRVQGSSFLDALQFLSDFSGLCIDVRSENLAEDEGFKYKRDASRFVKMANKALKRQDPSSVISEETISGYILAGNSFFEKDGFKKETLDFFEIGMMVDKLGVPRATIPIRDSFGRLAGMSARRTDGDAEPRYKIEWGFEKDKVLYNFHNAKNESTDTVIIVEGFKACWAVHEAGYKNVAACMGSVVTDGQASVLFSSHYMKCLLLLDGDAAGQAGMEISIPKVSRAMKVIPAYLPEGISPDTISRDELAEFIRIHLY